MILLHNQKNIIIDLLDFKENFFETEGEEPKQGTNELILEDLEQETPVSEEKEEPEGTDHLSAASHFRIQEEEKRVKEEMQQLLEQAKQEAKELLQQARQEGVSIKEQAYENGLQEGRMDGEKQAHQEYTEKLQEHILDFLMQFKEMVASFETERLRLVEDSIENLKDISVAVAEKVIQVSLKSSGEVIRRMIVSATEKLRYKQWVKIYISQIDSSLFMEANIDLVRSLVHLSENIKVVAMENAAQGTCIIELPDQIIDVSANTQLENIRGILKGAREHGGESHV